MEVLLYAILPVLFLRDALAKHYLSQIATLNHFKIFLSRQSG